ncbi:MAG: hypothetical protein Ct9H90mP14_2520 [Methanobacteriota archaeon]|nr:MAG: hypothetical protein Ct9H90mP14_2520 [Euryarchaeota archaeon]
MQPNSTHSAADTHPLDPEKPKQDYYRDRVHDVMRKHGVVPLNSRKSSRKSRRNVPGKRAICMHWVRNKVRSSQTSLLLSRGRKPTKGNTIMQEISENG